MDFLMSRGEESDSATFELTGAIALTFNCDFDLLLYNVYPSLQIMEVLVYKQTH